jgi:hypothetical protein
VRLHKTVIVPNRKALVVSAAALGITRLTMIAPVSFSTLMPVVDSWDTIKQNPAWKAQFGDCLFEK